MKFYVDIYLDHNLGDDLFLDTLLQRYPEHEFYVGIPTHIDSLNRHFEKYKNLKTTMTLSIKNSFAMMKYDAYILIGGSVYMDLNRGFHRFWLSRLIKSFICLVLGKPFFVIGANLGPFKTFVGKFLLLIHFNLVTHMSVRDTYSYNLLKKWKKFNTYGIAPDIVFSHKAELFKKENENSILGVSVINTKFYKHVQTDYVEKLSLFISKYLATSSSNRVIIFGFDGGLENDEEISNLILNNPSVTSSLLDGKVEVVNYSPEIDTIDFINKFNECDTIICSRFHAMILAIKYNKKILPICYSDKMENVLLDMNNDVFRIKYKDISNWDVDSALSRLSKESENKFFDKSYIASAEKHFMCIDDLIAKSKGI